MQNKLSDLNNHLFAELERLGDEELKGEELVKEIDRAKAVSSVASQIVSNGHLALKVRQFVDDAYDADARAKLPKMLED